MGLKHTECDDLLMSVFAALYQLNCMEKNGLDIFSQLYWVYFVNTNLIPHLLTVSHPVRKFLNPLDELDTEHQYFIF